MQTISFNLHFASSPMPQPLSGFHSPSLADESFLVFLFQTEQLHFSLPPMRVMRFKSA